MSRCLVFLSPGRCCWACERVLPLTPQAVLVTAPATPDAWMLAFVCDRADCAQGVVSETRGIGLGALVVAHDAALALIHGVDELEITEGWESALHRQPDVKSDGVRGLTDGLGWDRPWFVSRRGAAARAHLASLGMGTGYGGSACVS